MSMIKIVDVESVRFACPDIARMRDFLTDFGLIEAEDGGDGVLRMRGTGDAPYLHETVQGEPGFEALTLRAQSVKDLHTLAEAEGASVEKSWRPGGGWLVTLTDPDGYTVEVVAGQERAAPKPHGVRDRWNSVAVRERPGTAKRIARGPAHVVRLGHVVLDVSDAAASLEWYRSRFGVIMSDEVRSPYGALAAAFVRCDRGSELTDHHTLNFAAIPGRDPAFHHAAFEVADFDDLMAGHEHMREAGLRHDWGVGRHILGSQVFDYWKDPWGHRVEHWTDGDLFDTDTPTEVHDLSILLGQQWGPASPADFV